MGSNCRIFYEQYGVKLSHILRTVWDQIDPYFTSSMGSNYRMFYQQYWVNLPQILPAAWGQIAAYLTSSMGSNCHIFNQKYGVKLTHRCSSIKCIYVHNVLNLKITWSLTYREKQKCCSKTSGLKPFEYKMFTKLFYRS